MIKLLFSLFSFFIIPFGFAQTTTTATTTNDDYIRQPAVGISFVFYDYSTAQRMRSTSLTSVLSNKQLAKFNEMSPGLAVSYFQGVRNNIDFAATLAGTFVDNPRLNESTGASADNGLLVEADASFNFKLFSDQYWFTPYISAGIGASKFGGYYGAFVPLGAGLKVNIFDEAAIFINSQYRVPATQTNSHHFYNSIGIAGIIGRKKDGEVKTVEIP